MCQLSGAVLVGASAHFVNIFLTLTASLGSKGEIHFLQLKKTVPQREQGHSYCLPGLNLAHVPLQPLSGFPIVNEKCAVHAPPPFMVVL